MIHKDHGTHYPTETARNAKVRPKSDMWPEKKSKAGREGAGGGTRGLR